MKKMLKFICAGVLAIYATLFASLANAANYQDWWINKTQAGHGVSVAHQGGYVFAAWYTYDNAGQAIWFTLGNYIASNNVVAGDLNLFTGPRMNQFFDKNVVKSASAGTAKLTFTSNYTAVLEWSALGSSGVINLERWTMTGTPPNSGTYESVSVGGSNCTTGLKSYAYQTISKVTNTAPNSISITDSVLTSSNTVTCQYNGTYAVRGLLTRAEGTYSCTAGFGQGTWTSDISDVDTLTQTVKSRRDVMTDVGGCATVQTVTGSPAMVLSGKEAPDRSKSEK